MVNRSASSHSPRYQIVLPVGYQVPPGNGQAAKSGSGQTHDLSETGACLELPEAFAPGTRLSLHFQTDGGGLVLEATVVWADRASPSGAAIRHGVALAPVDPDQQHALQILIEREGSLRSRIAMAQPVPVRARATLEVRLLDLSLSGARIEHVSLLRPRSSCALEFSPPLGPLVIAAQVVRSTVVGFEAGPGDERVLRYESGVAFTKVTADQRVVLARLLEQLSAGAGVEGTLTVP